MGERERGMDTLEQARYERALKRIVPALMDGGNSNRTGLADLLDVNRSSLSRFLNRAEGYAPTEGRPEMLRILQRIEDVWHRQNLFSLLDLENLSTDEDQTDEEAWFKNYTYRLRYLHELDPLAALQAVGELVAQAVAAPAPYGASMGSNFLMHLCGVIDHIEPTDLPSDLVAKTVKRIQRVEAAVLESASEEFLRTVAHNPMGYAGYSLAFLGLQTEDDELLDQGLERSLRAALMPHQPTDHHWQNLLHVVEMLWKKKHERAEHWSAAALDQASPDLPDTLHQVLDTCDNPHVEAHWRGLRPDLFCRNEDGEL